MRLKQTFLLLLPFLLSLPILILSSNLEPRGGVSSCCGGDDSGSDGAGPDPSCGGGQAPTQDGPTVDQSPGMGVEFETGAILFQPVEGTITDTQTFGLKGEIVANRQGTPGENWALTADTNLDSGVLQAEDILDGRNIKLNQGMVGPAAAAAAADFVRLDLPPKPTDSLTLTLTGCMESVSRYGW